MGEWRHTYSDTPPAGERVLTHMKHGMLEGTYDPEEKTFYGYYWRDMEWFAEFWQRLPEPPAPQQGEG